MGGEIGNQLLVVIIDSPSRTPYRGRIAPSPTGYLHLGHARTFWTAAARCRDQGGTLVLRSEDLDRSRVRPAYEQAMIEDLRWFGIDWTEGPDGGGSFGPYQQSLRMDRYRQTLRQLEEAGHIYPCRCTRRDILQAIAAPHAGDEEPLYPGTCRPSKNGVRSESMNPDAARKTAWRFQVKEGEVVRFRDGAMGEQAFIAGQDFGDFVVWRNDDTPAYQLAVVVDDASMQITEVVRGADLLLSTARQILLYRALNLPVPDFFHCPLLLDDRGQRLAKRHDALSLRKFRELGLTPDQLRQRPEWGG